MSFRARKRVPDSESDFVDGYRSSKRTRGDVSKENTDSRHSDSVAGQGKLDSNGDLYWEISKARRVTISSFRGKTLVNIREYYEKDGHELPGKKDKGESIPRPQYDSDSKINSENKEAGDDSVDVSDEDTRRNIEATSEDDSE
ncbi:hypothetical protein AnigIFM60653_009055 [Aspergillus niger]|nr:hypothetical protein AnigIFM50267_011872 [Aspergillus niger]GKZ97588.1 hypothetical protein AnigIFM59636_000975 [Aspergillus niger]GLA07816.1 hypothetical protein AnigIFM60653_009055 [Aspergillus niger]GLA44035.1 hypothetical protein AnigIFM63309_002296 [Aspergillus niger]